MNLTRAAGLYHAALDDPTRAWLAARGLNDEAVNAARLGLVSEPIPGHEPYTGRLAIPFTNAARVAAIRFRCLADHDCKAVGCAKYLSMEGAPATPYNVLALTIPGNVIAVTEGELDALIMQHRVGIPAVGIPGATQWQRHWSRLFEDHGLVLVFGDGDDAGRKFAREVASKVSDAEIVRMPDGMDVTDLFLAEGAAGLLARAGFG